MKKFFTLIACAIAAVSVNAQKISFTADDIAGAGTLDGKTFANGNFTLTVKDSEGKFSIDANNAFLGDATEYTKYTHRLKTGGKSQTTEKKERWITLSLPTSGTLKIYARSGSSGAVRSIAVSQKGKTLFSEALDDSKAISVDLEENISDNNPTGTTKIFAVASGLVAAGEAQIDFPDGAVNFYAIELIAGEGPADDPSDDPQPSANALVDFPTSTDGITISGTTAWDNSLKYHANTETPKNISLANGYTTEGIINANYVLLSVEGGFKVGDVVSVAGYFSNSDEARQAAVTLFVGEEGEAPNDLWTSSLFINGRTVEADPTVETYTLDADFASLKLGRANGLTGATRTNVTLLKVERPTATGLKTILSVVGEDNAPIYNLAGQRVSNNYRGVVIKNGKKMIQK